MLLNKVVFSVLGIISLFFSLYLQFYLANIYNQNLINVLFLGITVCGVVITMATGGISSYLVSNFSVKGKHRLDIKNSSTAFAILFSIIGGLVFFALVVIGFFLSN